MTKLLSVSISAVLLSVNLAFAQSEYQETEASGVKVQTLTHKVQSLKSVVEAGKETPEDKALKEIGCDESQMSGVGLFENTVPTTTTVQTHTTGTDQNSQK